MSINLRQIDAAASASKESGEHICEVTAIRKPVTGDSVAPVSPAISPAVIANVKNNQQSRQPLSKSGNQSGNGNTKPNCYECKHRRDLVGDCHSSCQHPAAQPIAMMLFMKGICEFDIGTLHLRGNTHGVRSGWFMWPMNFDPVWVEVCSGFEEKS